MNGTTPQSRLLRLRQLLDTRPLVRALEAHNGLAGLIVENAAADIHGTRREFDAIWISSLTHSIAKGKPDIAYDLPSRLDIVNDILDVTTKPIMVDADNGGYPEHLSLFVRTLERLGVSALAIEDKVGPKKNSLDPHSRQKQDSITAFSDKIVLGKQAQVTRDFMIFARIESLVLGNGMAHALRRAAAYVEAGADGILIHSRRSDASEVIAFAKAYRRFKRRVPLAAVPTTYDREHDESLATHGLNLVIYANQLLRSAYVAMARAANEILVHQRSFEASKHMIDMDTMLKLIP